MIWVIGEHGMLGQQVIKTLEEKKLNYISSGSEVDITDYNQLLSFTRNSGSNAFDSRIEYIINCAAYTKVDDAEDEKDKAYAINAKGPENIAKIARQLSAVLIHISTDYVFDGSASLPINEKAKKHPIGAYGQTKSDGEDFIQKNMAKYFILRTAWLYGFNGKNFVYTMTKLMNSKDAIKVVADQRGTPTSCVTLSNVIVKLIEDTMKEKLIPYGIYNVTDEGETNWFEFAKTIQQFGKKYGRISENECVVNPCTTAEYPTKTQRPAYSVLDKTKIQKTLKIKLPDWKVSLKNFMQSKEFLVR